MRLHFDSVLESGGPLPAAEPNGAALSTSVPFSRQEAHAILLPRSGRVRAWPEEPTFERKTGRSESGHSRHFDPASLTSGLPR
jgi:hypothetical protein